MVAEIMELNSVQNQIVTPIVEESIGVLKEMANSEAWAGDEFQDSVWTFRFNGFAIVADCSEKGCVKFGIMIRMNMWDYRKSCRTRSLISAIPCFRKQVKNSNPWVYN